MDASRKHTASVLRFRSNAKFALHACCITLLTSIPIAAAQPPVKSNGSPANLVSVASPGKFSMMPAIHAIQQHHRLGKGDMYWSGENVKWIFNDGDVVCLFRGSDQKVYIFLPTRKAVFEQTFSNFRKRGITFTAGGQESCSSLLLKQASKQTQFQKFAVKTYAILSPARSSRGAVRMIDIGTVTAMAQQPKTRDMADFITIAYGLPKMDTVALDMTMRFQIEDASLWFKTSEKELYSDKNKSNQAWLRTIKLENVKVAADFFDAPKNFKKVDSQEKILGMAPATKDFEDLMFAEPNQKK